MELYEILEKYEAVVFWQIIGELEGGRASWGTWLIHQSDHSQIVRLWKVVRLKILMLPFCYNLPTSLLIAPIPQQCFKLHPPLSLNNLNIRPIFVLFNYTWPRPVIQPNPIHIHDATSIWDGFFYLPKELL